MPSVAPRAAFCQVAILLAMSSFLCGATASPLPEAIRLTLDQEYQGWKLAPVSTQVLQAFKKHNISRSPSLAAADFDHDGKLDYAVQIALTTEGQEEQIIIIFMARPGAYEETILQSMGPDPTVYLWAARKALLVTDAQAQEKVTTRSILMVLGGPIGETLYAYEEGRFQETKIPEDPDRPDPTIPRPAGAP